jgi:hypothetical protein
MGVDLDNSIYDLSLTDMRCWINRLAPKKEAPHLQGFFPIIYLAINIILLLYVYQQLLRQRGDSFDDLRLFCCQLLAVFRLCLQ